MAKIKAKQAEDGTILLDESQIELEDGTVLDLEEAERRIKFDSANTQRAQALADRERQVVEQQERLFGVLDKAADRLNQPSAATTASPGSQLPKMSVYDALAESEQLVASLKGLDFVGDASAVDRLTNALAQSNKKIAEAAAADNRKSMEFFAEKSAGLETQLAALARKQDETAATTQVQLTRRDAAAAADERNDRVLQQVLQKDTYAKLNLTPAEVEAIKTKRQGLLSAEYGEYDSGSQRWLWNDQATEDAIRLVPTVRAKMEALSSASARNDGLGARLRGGEASRSTPLRGRPPTSNSNEDFNAKLQEIAAGLESGQISSQDALSMLPTKEERQRFMDMRRRALERSKG